MSREIQGFAALRIRLLALFLPVAGPAFTADAENPQPPARNAETELGEVVVEGSREKPEPLTFDDFQAPFTFMSRLVGRFVVEGTVDLHAHGGSEDLRKVSGRVECVGFGMAPGVSCELKIRWPAATGPDGEEIPGGVSSLNPAVVLYGYEPIPQSAAIRRVPANSSRAPPEPGISWVVVDSKGIAETAVGYMDNPNTMRSRSKCLAVPGNCERVARITAAPDLKTVEMFIDLEIDAQKAVSFAFTMHRIPGTESVVFGRKPEKASKAEKAEKKK